MLELFQSKLQICFGFHCYRNLDYIPYLTPQQDKERFENDD